MIAVGAAAILIWLGGARAGLSRQWRWLSIAGLIALVWVANLVLPAGNPVRRITGGEAGEWGLLLAGALVVVGYAALLRNLRARAAAREQPQSLPAAPAAPIPTTGTFSEPELRRYARHIMLREIGGPGQKRLKQARVLVIGAGGLGAPALLYLAAAGVGTIGIVDDDSVDDSNLQRQVIHGTDSIGQTKVASAAAAMGRINPHVVVRTHVERLTEANAAAILAGYDVILDGTDSFATRRIANRTAAGLARPLVGGALSQWEGQLSIWDPARDAPCYHCIFPEDPAPGLVPTCAEAGVLGPLPGVIGTMMAAEAIKIITGAGDPLRGRLLIWDALYAESRIIAITRRADCPVCGAAPVQA